MSANLENIEDELVFDDNNLTQRDIVSFSGVGKIRI